MDASIAMTKVLIIDDADDVRLVAGYVLGTMSGMDVRSAESAEEGVRLAIEDRPDCILLDLVMPGTDGIETLALLRAASETRDVPVIFLTSKVRAGEIASRHDGQVAGVITKPFDTARLAVQVLEMLAQYRDR